MPWKQEIYQKTKTYNLNECEKWKCLLWHSECAEYAFLKLLVCAVTFVDMGIDAQNLALLVLLPRANQ